MADDEEYLQDKLSEAIKATKIAHYGPCPEWKGHSSEAWFFVFGIMFGLYLGVAVMLINEHM